MDPSLPSSDPSLPSDVASSILSSSGHRVPGGLGNPSGELQMDLPGLDDLDLWHGVAEPQALDVDYMDLPGLDDLDLPQDMDAERHYSPRGHGSDDGSLLALSLTLT